MVLLHVLDRQIEFTARTDFLWQSKLKVEQEEVETMRGINKILLENILPAHVAEHFLQERKTQVPHYRSKSKAYGNDITKIVTRRGYKGRVTGAIFRPRGEDFRCLMQNTFKIVGKGSRSASERRHEMPY